MQRQAQVKVRNASTGRFENVSDMISYARASALLAVLVARGYTAALSY